MILLLRHIRLPSASRILISREQIQLTQKNLESRAIILDKSFARYRQGGPAYERIVQDYLRIHLAILQCEEDIEELSNASGRLNGR